MSAINNMCGNITVKPALDNNETRLTTSVNARPDMQDAVIVTVITTKKAAS